MTVEKSFLVTVEARVRAEVAIVAPDKATATRRALEEGRVGRNAPAAYCARL